MSSSKREAAIPVPILFYGGSGSQEIMEKLIESLSLGSVICNRGSLSFEKRMISQFALSFKLSNLSFRRVFLRPFLFHM